VIAFLGYWIVNGTNGTSVASWLFVVDANVEELTAVGIRVKRVGYHGPAVTFYLRSLGTLEANDVLGFTSLTVSFSWILANATVRIENESLGAGDQIELAVGAEVELIANSRIGVSEVAVGTRTVGRFLSRLELCAVFAIDVEGVVALSD